jgi:Fe-S oxidoreductase
MGLIHWWAKAASVAPKLVNKLAATPVLSNVMKQVAGISRHRELPRFADETFIASVKKRSGGPTGGDRGRVILWPDTFNNHFHPEVCSSAVSVLERCGFQVTVPTMDLCCGRPLYDFGMLDLARHLLKKVLSTLANDIEAGTPIVVLEPSCASVFRDELPNLFPDRQDARRLSQQVYLLAEFLERFASDFEWPDVPETPLALHGHCHQKAIFSLDAERSLMRKLAADCEVISVGCCGMAGAFGFNEEHYEVSVNVGELGFLPKVRGLAQTRTVLMDGFSCREQAQQLAGTTTEHLAEFLNRTLNVYWADQE